jgi:hypothetical protein
MKKYYKIHIAICILISSMSSAEAQETPTPEEDCIGCIDGEMPEPGVYVISAWVRAENPPAGTTSYVGPEIRVTTTGGSTVITPANSIVESYIIDEWQLIEGTFNMPANNANFSIELISSGPVCYFDDVRFFPFNGSMKTYVYDPVNLRLSAELDERHYATLYEYDEEGKLKRIKKETERGVQTIQESVNSSFKIKEQ